MTGRTMMDFGYLNKDGSLIKLSEIGEQGEEIVLEKTCLEGRLMGDCRILGYYQNQLIVVDNNGHCFAVEV